MDYRYKLSIFLFSFYSILGAGLQRIEPFIASYVFGIGVLMLPKNKEAGK